MNRNLQAKHELAQRQRRDYGKNEAAKDSLDNIRIRKECQVAAAKCNSVPVKRFPTGMKSAAPRHTNKAYSIRERHFWRFGAPKAFK